jgi:hypothetical protein
MEKKIEDLGDLVDKMQKYIDQLNDTLINDVSKEMREANKQYRDLIYLAGELNARLAKR